MIDSEETKSFNPDDEVKKLLGDWMGMEVDKDVKLNASLITPEQAEQIFERAWEMGGLFYAFLFAIGASCGGHMARTDRHDCCVIKEAAQLRVELQEYGSPSNPEEVLRAVRDAYEDKAAGCSCCNIIHSTCVSVLNENERRKSLAAIAADH